MNRLSRIMYTLGAKSWDSIWLRNKEHEIFGKDEGLFKEPYRKSDLIYICISTTAKAISQVPLNVMQVNRSGELEAVPEDDPWAKIFKKPNPIMDTFSFVESLVSYILLDGDVWVVPYPDDYREMPEALYVVHKKHMEPIKDKNTNQLVGWRYLPNLGNNRQAQKIDFDPFAVSHSWLWNPYDPIMGMAPLEAGKISITTDYKSAKFNQLFFEQGASVGGIVSTENKLTNMQWERLRQQFEARHAGYEQSHKMMVLDGGLEYNATVPTHKDMSFGDLRSLDKERILQIYGMKKAIISVTDDLNYATSREQRKSWWQDTNLPLMRLVLSALNFTFFEIRQDTRRLVFDEDSIEALQEDFNDRVDTGVKLFDMGFTANEINQKLELGFEQTDWRDIPYVKTAVTPADPEEEEPEEPPEPEEPEIPEEPEEPEEPLEPEEEEATVVTKDKYDIVWRKVIKSTEKLEKDFEGKIKKAFFKMRQAILAWLNGQGKSKADDIPFQLNRPIRDISNITAKPMKKLKKEADILYELLMIAGIETLLLDFSHAPDVDILALPATREWLADKVIQLTGPDGIKRTIDKQLNRTIMQGIENEETIDQIADRVRGKFNSAANRAKTIARTESFSSINYGRNKLIEESDYKKKIWITALDEKVRDSHSMMHGTVIEANGKAKWNVGGSELAFPGDPSGPPEEIINCRCIEIVDLKSLESRGKEEEDKFVQLLDKVGEMAEKFGNMKHDINVNVEAPEITLPEIKFPTTTNDIKVEPNLIIEDKKSLDDYEVERDEEGKFLRFKTKEKEDDIDT